MKPFALPPLRRFGQNFLIDPNIKRKILSAALVNKQDSVLEIGPGQGALTFDIAGSAGKVFAVEVDRGLCASLSERAKENGNIEVICKDILSFGLRSFLSKRGVPKVKVISNLPYYITTPVLEYLFKQTALIDDIFLTVQKEAALRMTALPGKGDYGSLSCFVQYYCRPEILFKIPAGCFRPTPKVDSVFIRLEPIPNPKKYRKVSSEKALFGLIRTAFGQRRKKLRSSLGRLLSNKQISSLEFSGFLEKRPEEIALEEFVLLSNKIVEEEES